MEPDWNQLQSIAAEAELESTKPGWNHAQWEAFLTRAVEATNGNLHLTEFMAYYRPSD